MSKRAEDKALKRFPHVHYPFTPIDLSAYLREGYVEGYEQAKNDLALTANDVASIFNKVRELQVKYAATEGCLQEVADWFNEKGK